MADNILCDEWKGIVLFGLLFITLIALSIYIDIRDSKLKPCFESYAIRYCESKSMEFHESGLETFSCIDNERIKDILRFYFTKAEIDDCRKMVKH